MLLKASYLVDEVPGWVPPARSRKRLAVKPKRYLADPSLAAAQLGMGPDAIVELADGRWAAFEFKVGENKVPDAEKSLTRLKAKLCENRGARVREPEFFAVITGVSRFARQTPEGVYVIPVRCLAP